MTARSETEFEAPAPVEPFMRCFRRSGDLAVPCSVARQPNAANSLNGNVGELVADFEKRFPGGPLVQIQLRESVDDFSLTVLFGPSGSGKTTALRCLAGLERPDRGFIRFGGETWFDSERRILVPPQRRRVGYLFQDYALFPHLTIAQNIRYGLRRVGKTERLSRVAEIMDLLGLRGLENRYPQQVSGGQQQRVALARALVCRPRLLLLDEPLSALDVPTRGELRRQLRHWLEQLRMPGMLVTHDRIEALALGDHLVVLDAGKVRQRGQVHEVFSKPADLGVARIVGVDTVERATVERMPDASDRTHPIAGPGRGCGTRHAGLRLSPQSSCDQTIVPGNGTPARRRDHCRDKGRRDPYCPARRGGLLSAVRSLEVLAAFACLRRNDIDVR